MKTMKDYIAEMLEKESEEEVVKNFTSSLNDIKKEKAAKNEKAKDSEKLIKAINDYAAKYYPELELSLDPSSDELIKIFDEVKHYSEIYDTFIRSFFKD